MTARAVALLLLASLAAPLSGGCTQIIRPPANPARPAKVYVADYGLHSSIFLPMPTESGGYADDGRYVEFAFGDWSWMALGRTGPLDALAAVFVSPRSALGRRVVVVEHGQFSASLKEAPEKLTGFYADASDVKRLADALERRFARDLRRDSVWNEGDETLYAADAEHYWFAHHCNHVTVRWLRRLGCDVRGLFPTSHFKTSVTKANAKTPRTPR
jgi:hypothetical protein